MYYKLNITMERNNFIYPVPDINQITGAKYKKDMVECVCQYPTEIQGEGIKQITETQYNQYPKCRMNIDKQQINADGEDTAVITVTIPEASENETVKLYVDNKLTKFKTTNTNQAVFKYTTTQVGILEITAESDNWKMSDKKLLETFQNINTKEVKNSFLHSFSNIQKKK